MVSLLQFIAFEINHHPKNLVPIPLSIIDSIDYTMMIKFRFLDPLLARMYDSDGMAIALFTFVGFEELSAGKRTILVPSNVMEQLRTVLLTIMTFDCTNDNERKEVLPKIVANAAFFGQVAPRGSNGDENRDQSSHKNEKSHSTLDRMENTVELRTCDDIQRILQGVCMGDDLKIWIDTSSFETLHGVCNGNKSRSKPTSSLPGFGIENKDPNKTKSKKGTLPFSSSSSSPKPLASSLKAIAKAGNIKHRSPRISTDNNPSKPTQSQPRLSSSAIQETEIVRRPIVETDAYDRTIVLDSDSASSTGSIATPGLPNFSDFWCSLDASAHTVTTSSAVTVTSVSSNNSLANDIILQDSNDQNPDMDDDYKDTETRHILTLAGCAGYSDFNDFYCSEYEDDCLLSGLLISDDEYHSDEESVPRIGDDQGLNSSSLSTAGRIDTSNANCNGTDIHKGSTIHKTKQHLLPSFFETKTSLSSVTSLPPLCFGASDSVGTMGDGSSSVDTQNIAAFSSFSVASSMSMSMIDKIVGDFPRRKKDGIFWESSSLLEGHEKEMATILESVLDCILVPEDGDKNSLGFGNNSSGATTNPSPNLINSDETKHLEHYLKIPHYSCPTPKELLAMTMDWND